MRYWNRNLISTTERLPLPLANSGIYDLVSQKIYKEEGLWFDAQVVTDGLILYLDAGNSSSYPGSGTTWYDLSGNNNDATLTNGPTFSSDNNGAIVFDGLDDYVSTINISSYTNLTIEMWIYEGRNITGEADILTYNTNKSYTFSTPGGGRFRTDGNGDAGRATTMGSLPAQNQWYRFCYIKNGSLWIDETEYTNFSGSENAYGQLDIGRSRSDVNNFLEGKVSNVRVYSKSLSAAEVQRNYNALKQRFV